MNLPFYVVVFCILFLFALALCLRSTRVRDHARLFFLLYILCVLFMTLLIREIDGGLPPEFNPIRKYVFLFKNLRKTYRREGFYEALRGIVRNKRLIIEILLNILLFVPFGYLAPYYFKKHSKWWTIILAGFVFSLFIETTQFITHLGCFDAADLMHNTIGAWIGYGIWWKWIRKKSAEG